MREREEEGEREQLTITLAMVQQKHIENASTHPAGINQEDTW